MAAEKEIKNWYNARHKNKGIDAWRIYESYPIILTLMNIKKGRKFLSA